VIATEGAVHVDKEHVWHMDTIASFVDSDDGLLMKTPYQVVDLANTASEVAATEWWSTLTEAGGEDVVVKPLTFVASSSRGLLQPAVKCPGREYRRIIYGPEYTLPEHLTRLRERGLSGSDRWRCANSR
jgi:protein phosphatase